MGVDAQRLRDAVRLLRDTDSDSTFSIILDPEAVDGVSNLFGESSVLESGVPRMGGGMTTPVSRWLAEASHLFSQMADGMDEDEDEVRDACRELAEAVKADLGSMDPIEYWVRGAARTLRGLDQCPDSRHFQFLADHLEMAVV